MKKPRAFLSLSIVFLILAAGQLMGPGTSNAEVLDLFDIDAGLTGVDYGSVAWGDYDSDGYLDVLITGESSTGRVSEVYRNDGLGGFTDIHAGLVGVSDSSVAWGDYDSDGDLDILLTGDTGSSAVSKIYRNDGVGSFTDISAKLAGISSGSIAWGDYDSDGDLDILLAGKNAPASESGVVISKIYRNDGSGSFADIKAGIAVASQSSVAWGDYDSDGDLDIALAGSSGANQISTVYRNDGSNSFSDIGAGLSGIWAGSVAWGDYDADGDLDILLAGASASGVISRVYRNAGGVFSDVGAGLAGINAGSAVWGDYDADGDLDILLTGSSSSPVSEIYQNDGPSGFNSIYYGLTDVYWSSAAWGDYDADGALDILLAGLDPYGTRSAAIYANYADPLNQRPGAPGNPSSSVSGAAATLNWSAASDTETPTAGLTYNLRVGTTAGGSQVASSMAVVSGGSSGVRLLPQIGNAGARTSHTLDGLKGGTYYWSVQTIDSCFAGSSFTAEQQFTVPESFAFSASSYSVAENARSATITVTRTGSTMGPASVDFAVDDGTAFSGSDFSAIKTTLSFTNGETRKTVSVPIIDDSAHENTETAHLALSDPSAGATLGNPSTAVLTITDSDPASVKSTGKITSCKLAKTSFRAAQAGKVKLTCKFSPKSKVFKWALSLKKGKKWAAVKSAKKSGSFKTYTITVKKLFAGKAVKRGQYRLKLSADKNSKTLKFRVI